jgi:hypothetical protein
MRFARGRKVWASGEAGPVAGFAGVGRVYVAFAAKPSWRGSLKLVLEHSDDGEGWWEAESFTFTPRGQTAHVGDVAEVKDQLRVRWAVNGGKWDFTVDVGPGDRLAQLLGEDHGG